MAYKNKDEKKSCEKQAEPSYGLSFEPAMITGLKAHITKARESAANAVIREKVLLANELEISKQRAKDKEAQADENISSLLERLQVVYLLEESQITQQAN